MLFLRIFIVFTNFKTLLSFEFQFIKIIIGYLAPLPCLLVLSPPSCRLPRRLHIIDMGKFQKDTKIFPLLAAFMSGRIVSDLKSSLIHLDNSLTIIN